MLTGLAAIFLVELAIGIPAALRRDTTDDARATPRPVAQRTVAAAKIVAAPRHTVAATAQAAATVTPTATAGPTVAARKHTAVATAQSAATITPTATAVPTVVARLAAVRFAALQGAWQIAEANVQVGTMMWYADAVISTSGTMVLNAHKESVAGRSAVPCERQTDLQATLALGVAQQTVPYREMNCEGATSSGEVRVGSFTRGNRSFSGSFWRDGAKLGDFGARKM